MLLLAVPARADNYSFYNTDNNFDLDDSNNWSLVPNDGTPVPGPNDYVVIPTNFDSEVLTGDLNVLRAAVAGPAEYTGNLTVAQDLLVEGVQFDQSVTAGTITNGIIGLGSEFGSTSYFGAVTTTGATGSFTDYQGIDFELEFNYSNPVQTSFFAGSSLNLAHALYMSGSTNDADANTLSFSGGATAVLNKAGTTIPPDVFVGIDSDTALEMYGATNLNLDGAGTKMTVNGNAVIGYGYPWDPLLNGDNVPAATSAGDTFISITGGANISVTGVSELGLVLPANYIPGDAPDGFVGNYTLGGNVNVSISGAGSTWDNSGDLYIGDGGTAIVDVESGGTLSIDDDSIIDIATVPGAIGTLTVTGNGSFVDADGADLDLGDGGIGILQVQSGGVVQVRNMTIGDQAGSVGEATVDGDNSELDIGGNLVVGENGGGALIISNGGKVVLNGSDQTISIAATTSSTGSISVTGANSLLDADGVTVSVGELTNGSVSIQDGGEIKSGDVGVGVLPGASGATPSSIDIEGDGSLWAVTGSVIVGDFGPGLATVGTGGKMTITENLTVGAESGGMGALTVGQDGEVDVTGTTTIGGSGGGTVFVQDGATLALTGDLVLGGDATGNGQLYLSGTSATLTTGGDVTVGSDGTGAFNILGGAQYTTDSNFTLGDHEDASGTLDATDVGTFFSTTGSLTVGESGDGTLTVQQGAEVDDQDSVLAQESGSTATVDITDQGSIWHTHGDLTIGQGGDADVTVEKGATLQVDGDLTIAKEEDSSGTLTIDGDNTTFTYGGGDVTIGGAGSGAMIVQNSAVVDLGGTAITLGDEESGDGTLTVTGSDTSLQTGDLTVGGKGSGTLDVQDGASLTSASVTIGDEEDSNGVATVSGSGSSWTVSDLTVGGGGNGALNIDDGGVVNVSASELAIGDEGTGSGTLTITGDGSKLNFQGELQVGENGTGVFAVVGGASATISKVNIGDMTSGSGTVNVDGAGSKLEVQNDFNVGEGGSGSLNVTNGADLINDADATVADLGNSSGSVSVDAGSTWTVGGDLSVGHQGNGSLEVSAGSMVSATNVTIGEVGGGIGSATISGNVSSQASTLEFDNLLKVGDAGSGELDVDSGAVVKASGKGSGPDAGAIEIGVQSGSTGKVHVDGTSSQLIVTALSVGGAAAVSGGAGSLLVTNGGSVQASSVTVQSHGTVEVEAHSTLTATSGLTVSAGGVLGGGGTVFANVLNAGTVAPGDPQTLTINGNYTQMSGSVLSLDIGGTAAGQSDSLVVNGEFTLESGAALQLNFIGGFAPKTGQTFDLVDFESADPANPAFSTVDITGLATGFEYSLTSLDGGSEFELTALNDGTPVAAPEPRTWLLVLAGLALLGRGKSKTF